MHMIMAITIMTITIMAIITTTRIMVMPMGRQLRPCGLSSLPSKQGR